MNSSSTNILQIRGKMKGSNSEMLQNTDEMLACSSKMLQTARDPKKLSKTEKKTWFPKQFRILSLGNPLEVTGFNARLWPLRCYLTWRGSLGAWGLHPFNLVKVSLIMFDYLLIFCWLIHFLAFLNSDHDLHDLRDLMVSGNGGLSMPRPGTCQVQCLHQKNQTTRWMGLFHPGVMEWWS